MCLYFIFHMQLMFLSAFFSVIKTDDGDDDDDKTLLATVVAGTAAAKMLSSDAKRPLTFRSFICASTVIGAIFALYCHRVRLPAVLLLLLLMMMVTSS